MIVDFFLLVLRICIFILRDKDYYYNIIGDFWREISALICNFTCEITKLPWQPAVRLRFKMATKF